MKKRTQLIIIILILGVSFYAYFRKEKSQTTAQIGSSAPDFTLLTHKGKNIKLSGLKGKVVLLNFWATWCTPCIVELPSMEKLLKNFRWEDFEILAISIDNSWKDIDEFHAQLGQLPFPILLDQEKKVINLYGIRRIPESVLIDKKGTIAQIFQGAYDWDNSQIKENIQKLIDKN